MFNKGPVSREAMEKALIDCVKFLGHEKYDDCVREMYETYIEDYKSRHDLDADGLDAETEQSIGRTGSADEANAG